jgi:sec-independent protein translocase protein TatB
VFNLQGSEIIFILLIALVVLGPEKLPGAIRRATKTYAELRKMGDSFQSEFKSVLDEPLREMRETANLIKDQADPKKIAETAERELAAAKADSAESKPDQPTTDDVDDRDSREDEEPPAKIDYFAATLKKVDTFEDAGPEVPPTTAVESIDEWSDPVESDGDAVDGGVARYNGHNDDAGLVDDDRDDDDRDDDDGYRVASA